MRWRTLVSVASFLVAAVAFAAPASGVARHSCAPASARRLAQSHAAEVYQLGGSVYGCVFGRRHQQPLLLGGRTGLPRERVLVPTVAGTVAAYGVSQFGVDMVTTEVVVTRLTDGATLLRTPAATAPLGAEGIETVTALVAAPDGDVAWISSSGQIINPQRLIEVVRRDANGEAVLDSHAGIVTNSLHLRGSTLSWSDGAGAQTAPLN